MLNVLLNKGADEAKKGLSAYQHWSAITRKKKICSESVNKYNNGDNTFHAEECALLRGDVKWREKGGECSLRGRRSLRV